MTFTELAQKVQALKPGERITTSFPEGEVRIANVGRRLKLLSSLPEYRFQIHYRGREFTPRHADLLNEYLLKVDTKPSAKRALTDACVQVCAGSDPAEQFKHSGLPRYLSEFTDETWSMQMSMYQTGGLPVDMMLAALQAQLAVLLVNHALERASDLYRKAFLDLEQGQAIIDIARTVQPVFRPGKRYFNHWQRSAPQS